MGKLAFQKIEVMDVMAEAKTAAIAAAEKYSVKAREFCKMGIKIAEEAGAKAGKGPYLYNVRLFFVFFRNLHLLTQPTLNV